MKTKLKYEERAGATSIVYCTLCELPARVLKEKCRELEVPIPKYKWEMVDRLELRLAELEVPVKVVIG